MIRTCTLLSLCLGILAQPLTYANRQSDQSAVQERKEALNQIIEQRLEQKRQWEQLQKQKAANFAKGHKNPYTRTVTTQPYSENDSADPITVYLYTWPRKQVEKPKARLFTDPTDHLYIDWLELTRAHFTLRTKPIDQYFQTDSQASGELLLEHQSNGSTLGYSILGYHEFLREISPEAVQGYVESLRREYGNEIEIHNEWKYQPQATFPVFGGKWLYVDYTITPEDEAAQKNQDEQPRTQTRHRDYFIDLGDGIAIIRVQAQPAMFDFSVEAVEKSMRSSYRL